MTHRTRDTVVTVDLTSGTVDREQVPQRWLRQYLGGKGLGARYLYDRVGPGTDPLDSGNLLAVMLGPLSGLLPGEPRYAVVTKSPLTGGFLDSYSGGTFVEHLAGALPECLGVLVTGRAESPVRLSIAEGSCRIRPSEHWGADTVETAEAFPDAGVACVGPAGEQGVTYATIAADAGDHHAGRGGAGTVMGDKRLKAIVARGGLPEPGPELRALREQYERAYTDHETGEWQAAGGTFESVDFANEIGALATEGWQQTQFDSIEGIGVEAASDSAVDRESGTVPGDFRFETDDGDVVLRGAAPMTLGAGLGIDRVEDVARLAGTCDRLGVDVIDAGNAVAWTIRASEAGLVNHPIQFGDVDAAEALVEAIATCGTGGRPARGTDGGSQPTDNGPRAADDTVTTGDGPEESGDGSDPGTGLIAALANGVDVASDRFGGGAFIPTVQSMAFPSYDPRGSPGMALAYATSDRGACHRRARPIEGAAATDTDWSVRDRVRIVVGEQTVRSVLWSLIIDDFVGETLWEDLGQEWLASIDRPYTTRELTRVGERVWTLTRLFNAREGVDRRADAVPEEILDAGAGDGAEDGVPRRVDSGTFERALDAYYRARGWGPRGLPTRETLDRLGLLDVADDETPIDDPWDRADNAPE